MQWLPRPGGTGTLLDLRIQTSFTNTMSCDVVTDNGTLSITNARIIALSDANRSVLLARMQISASNTRMPPLASQVIDTDAVNVIEEWINSLQNCN